MALKDSLNIINLFKLSISSKIRNVYLNSAFYNNKISKLSNKNLVFKPSPNLVDCLVKYDKKKRNIDTFNLDSFWEYHNINSRSYKNLQSFFWLFTIDLKSSNREIQNLIENWIDKNKNFNLQNWEINILSKRIISWISNSKLTYEDSSDEYKSKFNFIIKKQVNHLKNEIDRSKLVDNKLLGCAAIILVGISYKDNNVLVYGLNLLKKIIIISFNKDGFPRSRNLRQMLFYFKHLVFIRELLKESQYEIPDILNEIIFDLGQSYSLFIKNNIISYLFNGNHENNNEDFDKYLADRGYKFNKQNCDLGGYILLNDKRCSLIMDLGRSPEKEFSSSYQSGALSFEFTYLNKKIICNSGFFQKNKHQLNKISRSSATHSTLIIDNNSSVSFEKDKFGNYQVEKSMKIISRNYKFEKDNWSINGSHDGYLKKYGIIHHRSLEYIVKDIVLYGKDKIQKKKNFKSSSFEIRFHLYPGTKVLKTVDGQTVLFEIENTGWKFTCKNQTIDLETGLFFGKKNSYTENQNICISGKTSGEDQEIDWKIEKI